MNNFNAMKVVPVIGEIILPQSEYEALLNYESDFDVTCYQIVTKTTQFSNYPLSPLLETHNQAIGWLSQLKKTEPLARISKQVFFYSSIDDKEREELIKTISQA